MRIVCIREGRVPYHIGDTVDVPDDVTVIDLPFFSHIDSDRSQAALKSVGKGPDGEPQKKEEEESSHEDDSENEDDNQGGTPLLRADANEDGGE